MCVCVCVCSCEGVGAEPVLRARNLTVGSAVVHKQQS